MRKPHNFIKLKWRDLEAHAQGLGGLLTLLALAVLVAACLALKWWPFAGQHF